jgi:ATP-dependent RNA helicase DDX56/DBP9
LALSSGRDLLVRAQTGSGKTLAYCLPVLQKLLQRPSNKRGSAGAIILVPTRELCQQLHKTLEQLTYYCDDVISIAVLSSGLSVHNKNKEEVERQEAMLRDRPDVIVATPNALLTHIRRGLVLKSSVETLVVDEADLILSFGYSDDLSEIVKSIPRIYQGMLMSATLSPELDSLKKVILHSPVVLKLEQEESRGKSGNLKQFFIALPKKDKQLVIYVFLKLGLLKGKGLFFVNSTDAGYRLKLFLEQFHIRSAVLNAELPFRSRLNIIEQFNVGNFDYLIATDSSTDSLKPKRSSGEDVDGETKKKRSRQQDEGYGVSRGLDFRNVSFVVNVDLPPNPQSYAHRIGRTARGNAKGVALSLVDEKSNEELNVLLDIQESQPRIPLAKASTDQLQAATFENDQGQPQPTPLDFDLREIEGFRYRVEDVGRAVTRTAVKETRAAEIKAELLNSERLQSHFEENPADLQILAHDRVATHVSKVQEHLKIVPKYLLPRGMQVANLNRKRKNRKKRGSSNGERRSNNDPLQNFDGEVNLDDITGNQDDPFSEFMDGDNESAPSTKKQKTDTKVFANTKDGTGNTTSGRAAWKEKRRKGKFSGKKRGKDRKYKDPLGI